MTLITITLQVYNTDKTKVK